MCPQNSNVDSITEIQIKIIKTGARSNNMLRIKSLDVDKSAHLLWVRLGFCWLRVKLRWVLLGNFSGFYGDLLRNLLGVLVRVLLGGEGARLRLNLLWVLLVGDRLRNILGNLAPNAIICRIRM